MLTDACDRNPMLTSPAAARLRRRRSIQILWIPSSFLRSFLRIVSDGASENDDRLSPEFASRPPSPRASDSRTLKTACLSLFPASAIFSFPLDWNSRHAALKKSLIGVPSGPDSITSSYAHGGRATRFPGTQLISGSRHHRFQQKELWMQNVFIV